MKQEIWKFVPYNTNYMVSNFGRVKSLNYRRTGKEKILIPGKNRDDYLHVSLWKDGNHNRFLVHRLVWEAFNGPIPEGMQVNHINERPWDNRLENLNLMTPKENSNWGTGSRRSAKARRKMIEQYTLDGTHICTWFSIRGIEKELGFCNGNISKCCNGSCKTSYGYVWKYVK